MFTTKKAAPGMLGVLALGLVAGGTCATEPPYGGTVWIDADVIVPGDATTLDDHPGGEGIRHEGSARRPMMYARNPDRWRHLDVHLYGAWYGRHTVEVQVNPHFAEGEARALAQRFARMLGQLPAVLRDAVDEIEINPGEYSASGFHRGPGCGIYLYADRMSAERNRPFAEEIILHEAAHCLEGEHRDTSGWRAARDADPGFISDHAREHPYREDFAETFSAWMAVRYRPDRLDRDTEETIRNAIPNRLAYLDEAIPHDAMVPVSRPLSYAVPFFPAADRTATGFLRIINRSDRAGTVEVMATDDEGGSHGPVSFGIGAHEARHFTAHDLEDGKTDGSLSGSLGDGVGDWWLTLTSGELEVVPLAYVRTPDGLLASMTEVVPAAGHHRYTVLFVNPCRNRAKISMLRIVNPGAEPVSIAVSGTTDAGARSNDAVLELPGGHAAIYRSCDLEELIGAGSGKWRLTLEADRPVWIMSLVGTLAGHLINLSAQTPIPYSPGKDG